MKARAVSAVIAALAGLGLATSAVADDWWLFSRTQGTLSFIDLQSVTRSGSQATVWLRRFEPGTPRSLRGEAVFEFVEHWQADCGGRRARVLEAQLLDRDGRLVAAGQGTGAWVPPERGTNAELLLQVICDNDRRELDHVAAADAAALKALVISGALLL